MSFHEWRQIEWRVLLNSIFKEDKRFSDVTADWSDRKFISFVFEQRAVIKSFVNWSVHRTTNIFAYSIFKRKKCDDWKSNYSVWKLHFLMLINRSAGRIMTSTGLADYPWSNWHGNVLIFVQEYCERFWLRSGIGPNTNGRNHFYCFHYPFIQFGKWKNISITLFYSRSRRLQHAM